MKIQALVCYVLAVLLIGKSNAKSVVNTKDISRAFQIKNDENLQTRYKRSAEEATASRKINQGNIRESLEEISERIKRDYMGLQSDITYLKYLLLKLSEAERHRVRQQAKYSNLAGDSSDIIDEDEDSDVRKMEARNYYGWMDFGK